MTWKIYQCADDYGDNAPPYFATFAKLDPTQTDPETGKPGVPDPSNPLYDNGVADVSTDTGVETQNADNIAAAIKADVLAGTAAAGLLGGRPTSSVLRAPGHGTPSNGAYFLRARS